tara:strand:+ start:4566 stop:4781 length:216 start_codon:yes stop_codon:yes gene_type:complete
MGESLKNASDYRVNRNVTIVGSAVDAILAVGKISGGFIAQSQALIEKTPLSAASDVYRSRSGSRFSSLPSD